MPEAGLLIRIRNRILRESGSRFYQRPVRLQLTEPVVSFTFDDFPRTALYEGGAILKRHGAAGTYYASAGMMGKRDAAGEMFVREDLEYLIAQGHEVGCHTYGHHDAMLTMTGTFERSIIANRRALAALCPGTAIRVFSYPKSQPHAGVKRIAGRHAACCRAGGQTFNHKIADMNCLKSFFLEQSRDDVAAVRRMINENGDSKGWLIFSTHDVCMHPSPYGCTPEFFDAVVRYAKESGARILTVGQVCEGLPAAAHSSQS